MVAVSQLIALLIRKLLRHPTAEAIFQIFNTAGVATRAAAAVAEVPRGAWGAATTATARPPRHGRHGVVEAVEAARETMPQGRDRVSHSPRSSVRVSACQRAGREGVRTRRRDTGRGDKPRDKKP